MAACRQQCARTRFRAIQKSASKNCARISLQSTENVAFPPRLEAGLGETIRVSARGYFLCLYKAGRGACGSSPSLPLHPSKELRGFPSEALRLPYGRALLARESPRFEDSRRDGTADERHLRWATPSAASPNSN